MSCPNCHSIPFGLGENLDNQTGAMAPGEIVVIAGKHQTGKSTLLHNIVARAVYGNGYSVNVLMFCAESDVKSTKVKMKPLLTKYAMEADYNDEFGFPGPSGLHGELEYCKKRWLALANAHGLSIEAVMNGVRQFEQIYGERPRIITIDHLQMFQGEDKKETRDTFLGRVMVTLKRLARFLGATIVVTSHVNRNHLERDPGSPYVLEDLRESGRIGTDADIVLAMVRYGPEHVSDAHFLIEDGDSDRAIVSWQMLKSRRRRIGKQTSNFMLLYKSTGLLLGGLFGIKESLDL